jgi:hypothetical protein
MPGLPAPITPGRWPRRGDDRAGALEHHDGVVAIRDRAGCGVAVRLDGRRVGVEQARSLAGMRREDGVRRQRLRGLAHGEQVERIRIEHQRLARPQRGAEQHAAPDALPQSGADREHVGMLDLHREVFAAFDRTGHRFGTPREQRRDMRLARGHVDQARATAQCSVGAQHDRAAAAMVATQAQHAPGLPLVRVAPPREQHAAQRFGQQQGPNAPRCR